MLIIAACCEFARWNFRLLAQAAGGQAEDVPFYLSPAVPFIVMAILFYVMMVRPEGQKRKAMRQMVDNLKKNDRVVTIGGIIGTVVNAASGSEDITIKVDEGSNTRLRIMRSAISRVLTEEELEKHGNG